MPETVPPPGCPRNASADDPRAGLFCPVYPRPNAGRIAGWLLFFKARHSWLHGLSDRAYRMKMGERHLLGKHVYMVNEPKWIRHVMIDAVDAYPKHRQLGRALEPLLGQSLLTANGARWERQRRMMNPAFEQARITVAFPSMLAAAQAMVQRLDALPDGSPLQVDTEMTHVTADIIFRTILSTPMEGDDARRVFAAFAEFQELAQRGSLPVLYGLGWLEPLLVPFWQRRRAHRAAAEIRGLLGRLIRLRFDAQRSGRAEGAPRDILGSLLEARDHTSGDAMSFDEVLDEVAMLFLAGHETSASALTWALHLIANAPDVQRRLHDEVDRVLERRTPGADDLRDLEFTRQIFRETLRLFPPVGFLARQAAAADTMRDKSIQPGAAVIVSPWLLQRHQDMWSHPDAFDPDRFSTDAGRASARTAYLPFSSGPRACIGASFALQEATLLIAMLAQRYRIQPAPDHVPEPVGRLTIRSANGVKLHLHRRR